jgi:DNA repair exonuclease SbcCD ATPase subunit
MLDDASFQRLLEEAKLGNTRQPSALAPSGYSQPSNVGVQNGMGALEQSYHEVAPAVSALRDRLLQQARDEHQRCLEVAEAALGSRSEKRRHWDVGTQTETSDCVNALPRSASQYSPRVSPLDYTGSFCPVENCQDDKEQEEAIQALLKLNENRTQSQSSQVHACQLTRQLQCERAEREKIQLQLAKEFASKEATQQQIFCLERELDAKEGALQASERRLARRDRDLKQAQLQIQVLQDACGHSPMSEDPRCRQLRSQLSEREQQLEAREQQIARLVAVLRTHGVLLEDLSTTCGSERSASVTASSASNY